MAEGSAKQTAEGIKGIGSAAAQTKDSLAALTGSVVEGGKEFDKMLNAASSLSNTLKAVGGAAQALGGLTVVLGPLGNLFEKATGAVSGLFDSIIELSRAYYEGMGALDAFSSGHRQLQSVIYDLGTQFGKTFDEVKNFSNIFLATAGAVKGADFGWLTADHLGQTAKAIAGNRVNIEQFAEVIETTAGSMDLLTAATLQAGTSGLETSEYFNTLSQAMLKQGLEAQDAMEQIASFKDLAEDTGLSVRSISGALSTLGNSFSKLGISADFGRPLIKGFADSISDMGLGIENATELASTLSNSLATLATDYSTMYVTAQRGNLAGMMGGGALGAGIQMQARMLEAEGDPNAQAQIGAEMATALRDTIASFAGGDITTVQEAAANPALEAQFYTQQRLLQQMYNLDDQTAARTLDLLDKMGAAVDAGNTDLAQSLGEDLQDVITKNDETMDLQEKANAYLSGLLSEAMATNEALFYLGRETLGDAALNSMNLGMETAFGKLEAVMSEHREAAQKQINAAQSGDNMLHEQVGSLFKDAFGDSTGGGLFGGDDDKTPEITTMDGLFTKMDNVLKSNLETNGLIAQFLGIEGGNRATKDNGPSVSAGGAGAKSNP